jgi:hypothetical protein
MELNSKLKQLYRIIELQTREGQIRPPIRVSGYKLEVLPEFEAVMKSPSLRKKFWEDNHVKLNDLGIDIKRNFLDFESHYELDSFNDLSYQDKAKIARLKLQGFTEVPTVSGNCPTTAGYFYERFPTGAASGAVVVCLAKAKSDTNYPLKKTDDPLYCIKNQKYYSLKRGLLASFNKDRQCQKIDIEGTTYWICYFFDGKVEMVDINDNVVMKGGWSCIPGSENSYTIVFSDGQTLTFTVNTKDEPIVGQKI